MDIDLIMELILRLLGILSPANLDKIKKKITELEEERVKTKQEALAALEAQPINVAALERILSKLLDVQPFP